jgi:DNA-binding transcriptional ArsR family regulator
VPDSKGYRGSPIPGGDSALSWEETAKFFKALGDETRLKIVSYLLDHQCFACDFASMTQKDQTTVSRHLKVLVEAGILKFQKKGRHVIYSIRDNKVGEAFANFGIKGASHSCCSDGQPDDESKTA